jgi:hypothetical protein
LVDKRPAESAALQGGGADAADGKSAAAAKPGVTARTIEIAKRIRFNDTYKLDMNT